MTQSKSYSDVKKELNNHSCSLCLAKWTQVTLHLQTGMTHSCHHVPAHKIPLVEIETDPSALHNTSYKKEKRKQMLEGERPAECDYCWNIEDSDKDNMVFSDRVMKSAEDWSYPYFKDITNNSFDKNINPKYLEVSFSSVCNFKCSYCLPEVSSKWMEEIKQYGPYPTSTRFNNIDVLERENRVPIPHREHNPYVEAFWKWWPELYPNLQVFRITGGEPLMCKDTFKVLDYIIENPNPNLELNINSNLCVPDSMINSLIEKMKRIQSEGMIKEFKLYTSCEAKGAKAEYIRHGLNYNQWLDNCYRILNEIPQSKLTNMATYNALSVSSYKEFMQDFIKFRYEFNTGPERRNPISMDAAYLRWPQHQSVFILDHTFLEQMRDQVTYMYLNKEQIDWPPLCGMGFYEHEITRMRRNYQVFQEKLSDSHNHIEEIKRHRSDFYKFITEHDRRRGTNFLKTFPEMEEFYNMCKSLV
jgi:organic radical activating enzyme